MKRIGWAEELWSTSSGHLGLADTEVTTLATRDGTSASICFNYPWTDIHGRRQSARGRIHLPLSLRDQPHGQVPLVYAAGYEIAESAALAHVEAGRAVVTTVTPVGADPLAGNPVCRGVNVDLALASLVRALAFVDVTKTVITGISAGGYMALLVAAASFPVAGVAALCPPLDLAYWARYGLVNEARADKEDPELRPWFLTVVPPLARLAARQYGPDLDNGEWRAHSPIAHLPRITCPVIMAFSEADMLVPVEQLGGSIGRYVLDNLPADVVMDSEDLGCHRGTTPKLLDLLDPSDVYVHRCTTPPGAVIVDLDDPELADHLKTMPLPPAAPRGQQWIIAVLDEGLPLAESGHFLHLVNPDFEPFFNRCLQQPIDPDQLTEAKLRMLMRRCAGEEWLSPTLRHSESRELERGDVTRGLRAYCAISPAHATRFGDLYDALPSEQQALDDTTVEGLVGHAR